MEPRLLTCEQFVTALASKSPVPGGGGAAAIVGAVGTALGNMVGSLTAGKKKYAAVEADILRLQAKADALQDELLDLAAKDAAAFESLFHAYGLPAGTDAEKAHKTEVLEGALKDAASVPLEIMRKCGEAIRLHEEFSEIGSAGAISDVGVGVACVLAALKGASLNVFINTKAMTDRIFAFKINQQADALLFEYVKLAENIYNCVEARLK
jgi:formiminotetrahydrofolate cyclodeaminase